MSKQSLLILSLDGASWEGFAPWLEQGRMPTLRGLMESGSSGTLQAVLPLFVYPNWASFWTGENPGQHTIFAFATLGETSVVGPLVDSRTLKRPTWLQLVSDHGLRVVSIYAQLTYPPQPLNGYVVSELHMREANNFTHPPDLAQELRSRFRPLLVPKSEQYFPSGGLRSTDDVHEFVQKQIQSIVQTKDVARYVLGKSPWDVGVIHFFATDPLQHALWHGVDPRHPRFDSKVHREVGEFFSALDAAMGDLIEATNPEAVVVLSLHGFTTTSKILNLSRFLGEVGILKPLSFPRRLIRKSMRIRGVGRLAKMIPRVRQIFKRPPWKPRNVFLDHKAIYVHKTEGNSKEITNTLVSALESLEDPENGCRVLRKAWRGGTIWYSRTPRMGCFGVGIRRGLYWP